MNNQESDLIARILAGSTEDYRILVERYQHGLYLHCFGFVKDEDVAEDLAQEAFIQAYNQLSRYDNKYRFSTWLYRIASNKAIDHCRRTMPGRLDDEQLRRLVATQPTAEDEIYHRQLREAVANLPQPYRQVVTLRYWQGQTYQEIATKLGAPIGSVRGWLNRAKHKLRKEVS